MCLAAKESMPGKRYNDQNVINDIMVILLFNFIDITNKIKLVDVLKEYKDHSSL